MEGLSDFLVGLAEKQDWKQNCKRTTTKNFMSHLGINYLWFLNQPYGQLRSGSISASVGFALHTWVCWRQLRSDVHAHIMLMKESGIWGLSHWFTYQVWRLLHGVIPRPCNARDLLSLSGTALFRWILILCQCLMTVQFSLFVFINWRITASILRKSLKI